MYFITSSFANFAINWALNSQRGRAYFGIPQFVPGTVLYKENYINLENKSISDKTEVKTPKDAKATEVDTSKVDDSKKPTSKLGAKLTANLNLKKPNPNIKPVLRTSLKNDVNMKTEVKNQNNKEKNVK